MNSKAALLTDRTVLEITGEDRVSFLQGLVTNDVEKIPEGEARFAGLLTPQGKILFDFFIVPRGGSFLLDCPVAVSASLAKRLSFYKLRAKVAVADVSSRWRVAAAWGEGAADWARVHATVAYQDPRLPELGFRMVLSDAGAPQFAATLDDYETMRIALAVPGGGKDYAYGDAFPHEACFDLLHGVNFKKGCFIGQEVVSRMQHRGTARTRVLAVSAKQNLPHGGAEILTDGLAIGRLGSAAGDRGVALARADRVRDAIARGQTFSAGGIPVELAAPAWATYTLDVELAGAAH